MFSSVWSEYLAWNEGVRRFKSCNTDQYKNKRSVAQSGSASALGAEGRRFDPCHSDQYRFEKDYRCLAQFGRATRLERGGIIAGSNPVAPIK